MSTQTREIVTLQCGHYANFVGTHLWNIQESTFCYDPNPAAIAPKEINHDVLYREGRTLQGEVTYTPRLVCLDLNGSLNTLRAEGVLYDLRVEEDVHWGGDVTLHKTSPAHKNQFLADLEAQDEFYHKGEPQQQNIDLSTPETDTMEVNATSSDSQEESKSQTKKHYNLDEDIAVWSDYLHGHLHPKSISVIKEYSHRSSIGPFELFTQGRGLLSLKDTKDEIEDKLHFFVEECDHLQGFHVLLDFYDGFSGLGSGIIESLADDFHGKGIFALGVSPAYFEDSTPLLDSYRIINSVLSFSRLTNHSSLFVPASLASTLWRQTGSPVNFTNMNYKPTLPYHTAAILASTFDTATLPFRTVDGPVTVSMMTDALATGGRKIGCLSTSHPFPLHSASTLADTLGASLDSLLWQPITPHVGMESVVPFTQSVVLRGVPENRWKRPPQPNLNPLHMCHDDEEMLRNYLLEKYPRTLSSGRCVRQACSTVAPFPHIFSSKVNTRGFLSDLDRPEGQDVESIPMMTCLQSSPAIQSLLSSLVKEAQRLDIHKFHGYFQEGMEEEEYRECLNELQQMAGYYESDLGCLSRDDDDDDDEDDDIDDV